MGNERPTDDASRVERGTWLAYERPRRSRRHPLVWQGVGSVILGLFVLLLGTGFVVAAAVILAHWSGAGGALRVMSIVLAVTGIAFVAFASVCFTDAIVELSGREPPRWRWYQTFGRNRRR